MPSWEVVRQTVAAGVCGNFMGRNGGGPAGRGGRFGLGGVGLGGESAGIAVPVAFAMTSRTSCDSAGSGLLSGVSSPREFSPTAIDGSGHARA